MQPATAPQRGPPALSRAGLAPLIDEHGAPARLLAKSTPAFTSLAKAIVYQQLSGSSAAAIYGRFLGACDVPDEGALSPAAVLSAPLPSLRAAGLSERKSEYLRDLAAHFADGRLSDGALAAASGPELRARLTAVKGVGPWSVDMHAIFHRGETDVLPVGDLGVRKVGLGCASSCRARARRAAGRAGA